MLTQIIISWTLITCSFSRGTRLSEIRLPSRHDVKYMPAGYKKEKVVSCPAPSTSSSGGGEAYKQWYWSRLQDYSPGFNVWTFLTSGVLAATVVGNIVNNVNSNNNNNNNNNNQDSQNNNNQNVNNNANENMNMNMVNMAMGRKVNDDIAYKILCLMLTLIAKGQAQECLQRVICETKSNYNRTNSSSDISRILYKISRFVFFIRTTFPMHRFPRVSWRIFNFSISAGLITLDYLADLDYEAVSSMFDAINNETNQDCHTKFPCIPFLDVYRNVLHSPSAAHNYWKMDICLLFK